MTVSHSSFLFLINSLLYHAEILIVHFLLSHLFTSFLILLFLMSPFCKSGFYNLKLIFLLIDSILDSLVCFMNTSKNGWRKVREF